MLIYIFVALWPLLIGNYYVSKVGKYHSVEAGLTKVQYKERRNWLLAAAIPMFLLIALRGKLMGADTLVYLKFYQFTAEASWGEMFDIVDFEPGFVIFEKLVSYISKEPLFFQITYTAVYLITMVHFANQMERAQFLFLFFFATLGIYAFMFTGVRQCLAMCICLFSYDYVKKRRIIPFLLCIALAYTFHKSSILFLSAYFVYPRKLNVGNILLYAFLAVVFFLNIDTIQEWFNQQLDYAYEVERTGNGLVYLLVVGAITLFSAAVLKPLFRVSKEYLGVFNISIIALVFWILRLATRVAERPSFYFLFFTMVVLSYAIGTIRDRQQKLLFGFLIIGLSLVLYVYRFINNFSSLVPYVTAF